MDGVTYLGDPWEGQRKLIDQLAAARSGKHGAFIVFREAWRWFVVNLPNRLWPRTIVITTFVFGILGLVVGGVLKVLGAPGSLTAYGAGIGAAVGLLVALVGFADGARRRSRLRRSLR